MDPKRRSIALNARNALPFLFRTQGSWLSIRFQKLWNLEEVFLKLKWHLAGVQLVDALPVDALPVDVLPVGALPIGALPVGGLPADGSVGVTGRFQQMQMN